MVADLVFSNITYTLFRTQVNVSAKNIIWENVEKHGRLRWAKFLFLCAIFTRNENYIVAKYASEHVRITVHFPETCTVSPMYMRSEGQVFALRNTHTLSIIQAAESEGKVGKVK